MRLPQVRPAVAVVVAAVSTPEPWETDLLEHPRLTFPPGEAALVMPWLCILAADLARGRSREWWIQDVKHRLGLITIRSDERS